jgi:hypothetical protein
MSSKELNIDRKKIERIKSLFKKRGAHAGHPL